MKPPLKSLLGALGAGLFVVLAFFGWSVKAKDGATYRLANGVEVTPIEVKPDDTARLLEAKIWKFDVVCPNKANTFAGFALCQSGKPPKTIVGGIGLASTAGRSRVPLTVGLAPVAGTFMDAQQLRYSLFINDDGATGTIPNPFVHSHGYTQDVQVMAAQNQVLLMGGNVNKAGVSSSASHNELALSLVFSVSRYSK